MKVHGYEVPKKVESAVLKAMSGEFTAAQLTVAAIAAGAPETIKSDWTTEFCASRIVGRLLRREKTDGKLAYGKGVWRVVKTS